MDGEPILELIIKILNHPDWEESACSPHEGFQITLRDMLLSTLEQDLNLNDPVQRAQLIWNLDKLSIPHHHENEL